MKRTIKLLVTVFIYLTGNVIAINILHVSKELLFLSGAITGITVAVIGGVMSEKLGD